MHPTPMLAFVHGIVTFFIFLCLGRSWSQKALYHCSTRGTYGHPVFCTCQGLSFQLCRGRHIPWFNQVGYCEEDAEHNTETSNHNICDTQEVVLAAHD